MADLTHAPPPKTVDGLFAVPIDITQIDATLTFDGATSSGSGDATIQFIVGPAAGNPIFDLRQTIAAAWLDGAPLPVAKLATHDFGGGPNAALRVVEAVLAAGTTHTLRVVYSLGTPQASNAGSYQPAMTFSAGPRLAFNFGFTDLGAGRYLEAWVPANLIYDRFAFNLELRVNGTGIAHSAITNGSVTNLGPNHWSVAFPSRFTALSPLLEVRATDTLVTQSSTVLLPVSGTTVTIELWKLASNAVDLAAQMASLKTYLVDNESTIGRYLHGSRFVAFLNVGGMEYDGGTTTGPGALRHETHHSWWGRGVKPANQSDGWFDEGWTVYHNNGANGSLPFDFTAPATELCPQNPWVRVTAAGSYSDGERFFRGAAALVGVAPFKALMAEFYSQNRGLTVATTELETFLVARSGKAELVDAFHRFVYGLPNPTASPDLWIKDDPGHTGAVNWPGAFWNSPDLWIRNHDDGGPTHQPPEFWQDNWFYARVRNRSATITVRHFVVAFNVKSFAGVQFQYPADFLPAVAAASGFDLAPGGAQIVKARWPRALVPPPGTHACWLAAVLTRSDQPTAGRHVWEHNNLAQKNLAIVDLQPNRRFILPFVLARPVARIRGPMTLELVRPKGRELLEAELLHRSATVFAATAARKAAARELALTGGAASRSDANDLTGGSERGSLLESAIDDTVGSYAPPAGPRVTALDCAGLVAERRDGFDGDGVTLAAPDPFAGATKAPFPSGGVGRLTLRATAQNPLLMGFGLRVPADAQPGEVIRMDLVQRMNETITGGLAIEIHVRS